MIPVGTPVCERLEAAVSATGPIGQKRVGIVFDCVAPVSAVLPSPFVAGLAGHYGEAEAATASFTEAGAVVRTFGDLGSIDAVVDCLDGHACAVQHPFGWTRRTLVGDVGASGDWWVVVGPGQGENCAWVGLFPDMVSGPVIASGARLRPSLGASLPPTGR